jgi:hypothetical protein
VFIGIVSLSTIAMIVAYLALRYDLYATSDLVLWGLQGWCAFALFGLPYVCLCTWISSTIDSPFGSLAIVQLLAGVPVVLIKYVNNAILKDHRITWLDRLTPWGWKYEILHPDPMNVATAAAVMLAFAAFFLFLAIRKFDRRDL